MILFVVRTDGLFPTETPSCCYYAWYLRVIRCALRDREEHGKRSPARPVIQPPLGTLQVCACMRIWIRRQRTGEVPFGFMAVRPRVDYVYYVFPELRVSGFMWNITAAPPPLCAHGKALRVSSVGLYIVFVLCVYCTIWLPTGFSKISSDRSRTVVKRILRRGYITFSYPLRSHYTRVGVYRAHRVAACNYYCGGARLL